MPLTAITQNTIRDTILNLDSKTAVILYGSRRVIPLRVSY